MFEPQTKTRSEHFGHQDSGLSQVRLANLWNAIPDSIKSQTSMSSFKNKLKYFFVERLKIVFDGDNIRSYKLICPKCRRVNPMTICSC